MPIESQEALDEIIGAWHHPRMQEALRPLITAELTETVNNQNDHDVT